MALIPDTFYISLEGQGIRDVKYRPEEDKIAKNLKFIFKFLVNFFKKRKIEKKTHYK